MKKIWASHLSMKFPHIWFCEMDKRINEETKPDAWWFLHKLSIESKNEGYVRDFIRDSITKEDGS
jgi:hypothetical protein